MTFNEKPNNQLFDVVDRMRGFKFDVRNQIIDEHTRSCAKAPVGLLSARRVSPCWQTTNDRLCKLLSQNRVRNFGLSTYLPSRTVTVVKRSDGTIGSLACGTLRPLLGKGALRDGSTQRFLSRALNCERKRIARMAVRRMPFGNEI